MTRAAATPITALLADGDDVASVGLKSLLGQDPRFAIVGAAGRDLPRAVQRHHPRVVVLDPATEQHLAPACIRELAQRSPESGICVHTALFEPQSFLAVMLAGAHGYFLKGSEQSAVLLEALWLIGHAHVCVIDPAVRARFQDQGSVRLLVRPAAAMTPPLTARERAVLRLLADGLAIKQVAVRLEVGRSSVDTYLDRLRAKLGGATPAQLVARAFQHGLLDD